MNIQQWIEKVLTRLAELIGVNRGQMVVSGNIGQVDPVPEYRYKRVGLTVSEAFELTYMRGQFDVLAVGQPDAVMKAIMGRIQAEMNGSKILVPTAEEKAFLLSGKPAFEITDATAKGG